MGVNLRTDPRTPGGLPMTQPVTLDPGVWHMFVGAGDTSGTSGVLTAGTQFNLSRATDGDVSATWRFRDCLELVGGVGNYTGGQGGDYVDFMSVAPATAATSTPGTGNANKYDLGGGANMFTPAAGDGDWTITLNDGSAHPVPSTDLTGYWSYTEAEKGWGTLSTVYTATQAYNLFDFEIQLTKFVGKVQLLGANSLDFDPQNVHPTKILPEWDFRCTLHNEGGAHTVDLAWRLTTARKLTE